jgi:hypothetical protein
MKFDVGECIRVPEFKEFFRKQDLKVWDVIQIILHSYAPMKQKREWLYRLLQTVVEAEKQEVQDMLDFVDLCLRQIYQTDESVVYVAECRYTSAEHCEFPPEDITTSVPADLTFHDNIAEMAQYIEETYTPKTDEPNREMYIYQIIKNPNEKHRVKIEFSMTWFDGKLEVFHIYPHKDWLEQEGIDEKTYLEFRDGGICYRKLPFSKGDRLRIKTPLMWDYFYGTVTFAEYVEGAGCYYFTPDAKETDVDLSQRNEDLILLNYHELELTSGYALFDWVERVKE